MSEPRLLSLLIPAVGGQGGGVLAEWIVDAAQREGYPVQSTSIPGVAQRTGSTTYYVELFAARGDGPPPNFSLYPVPGALDVLLAPEFLEVGRMIDLGFPSPAVTTIVTSTHRLYSIHEKVVSGRGIYPAAQLEAGARAFARRLVAFDALALAREHDTEVNAILLGALAGSGALPVREAAYREAIADRGIAVEANLRGFTVGLETARRILAAAEGGPGGGPAAPSVAPAAPAVRVPAGLDPEAAGLVAAFPEAARPVLAQAWPRLVDYQDRAYARRYLEYLGPIARLGDAELTGSVARHLAVWMTYEDAVRVAQLKTRPARFARIREEARAGRAEIVVTDFLKPDLDEIWGVLPYRLVAPFARWARRRWPQGRPTLAQHVKTTTISGYLRLWLVARLRPLRPISYRAREEHERMARWLAAVERCAGLDGALAREVAALPRLLKGYGEVRRRLAAAFDDLLTAVLDAAALEPGAARELAARGRALVLQGPEGEAEAAALARATLARLGRAPATGACRV